MAIIGQIVYLTPVKRINSATNLISRGTNHMGKLKPGDVTRGSGEVSNGCLASTWGLPKLKISG